ncbi:MAG: hypothetical protein FJY85_04960 [Deltaproteobacteria bacterium]|nr:hypothetical protein [Deltaproteobacteria bacterium]
MTFDLDGGALVGYGLSGPTGVLLQGKRVAELALRAFSWAGHIRGRIRKTIERKGLEGTAGQ